MKSLNTQYGPLARHVSFLAQSFTGMSWDGPGISHAHVDRYVRKGRELRARAARRAIGSVVARIGALAHRARRALAHGRERRASIRALMALDDHVLRDIGVQRGEIRRVVDELLHEKFAEPVAHPIEAVATTRKTGEAAANDDGFRSAA